MREGRATCNEYRGRFSLSSLAHHWFGRSLSPQVLPSTITDPSGAVQGNAQVTAVQEQTGARIQALLTEDGQYSFPALRPGTYTITVTAPGFKQSVQSGVTLQVNQSVRLDIRMELGSTTEQVNVIATTPLLETETSGRGSVIDTQKIVELPLNGRDYNQLALLSPGVFLPTPRLQSIEFKGAFNVNGNRAFQNAFSSRRGGQYLVFKLLPWR